MFGLFGKPKNPRDALLAEIKRFETILKRASPTERFAMGHSVNMATELFTNRFGGLEAFLRAERSEHDKFMDSLVAMAVQLMQRREMHSAAGFRLFNLWLCGVLEDDSLRDGAAVLLDELRKSATLKL